MCCGFPEVAAADGVQRGGDTEAGSVSVVNTVLNGLFDRGLALVHAASALHVDNEEHGIVSEARARGLGYMCVHVYIHK